MACPADRDAGSETSGQAVGPAHRAAHGRCDQLAAVRGGGAPPLHRPEGTPAISSPRGSWCGARGTASGSRQSISFSPSGWGPPSMLSPRRHTCSCSTTTARRNIETFDGGTETGDADYARKHRISEKAIRRGVFLRNLTTTEFVAQVRNNLGVIYSGRRDSRGRRHSTAVPSPCRPTSRRRSTTWGSGTCAPSNDRLRHPGSSQ